MPVPPIPQYFYTEKEGDESRELAGKRIRRRIAPQLTCDGRIMEVKFLVRPHNKVKRAARDETFLRSYHLPKGFEIPPPWEECETADTGMFSPVHWAAARGHAGILKALMENGACLWQRDSSGTTPLHLASKFGHAEAVQLLSAHEHPETCCVLGNRSADVNAANKYQLTALHYACMNGHLDVVQFLLARGAKPILEGNRSAITPLHMACVYGHIKVVKALLAKGVDCNTRASFFDFRQYGPTPLASVCWEEHMHRRRYTNFEVVRLLLQRGADGDIVSTVLSPKILGLLLDYGKVTDKKSFSFVNYRLSNGPPPMCAHRIYRSGAVDSEWMATYLAAREHWTGEDQGKIDTFEKFFIKAEAAGLRSLLGFSPDEVAADPPVSGVDWTESQRNRYRAECVRELELMKAAAIPNTSANYYDLLTRNLPALWEVDHFDFDGFTRQFPVYGDLTDCGYVKLRPVLLMAQSKAFFRLTEVQLPPECAEMIQVHLTDWDLHNLLKICQEVWEAARLREAQQENRKRKRDL